MFVLSFMRRYFTWFYKTQQGPPAASPPNVLETFPRPPSSRSVLLPRTAKSAPPPPTPNPPPTIQPPRPPSTSGCYAPGSAAWPPPPPSLFISDSDRLSSSGPSPCSARPQILGAFPPVLHLWSRASVLWTIHTADVSAHAFYPRMMGFSQTGTTSDVLLSSQHTAGRQGLNVLVETRVT